MRKIHALGLVHVTDTRDLAAGEDKPVLEAEVAQTRFHEERLAAVGLLLRLLETYYPEPRSFVNGLVSLPKIITEAEVNTALRSLNLKRLQEEASKLDDALKTLERRESEVTNHIEALRALADLPFAPGQLKQLSYTTACLVSVPNRDVAGLLAGLPETSVTLTVRSGEPTLMLLVYRKEDDGEVRGLMARHGAEEIALPEIPGTVREALEEYTRELQHIAQERDKVIKSIAQFLPYRSVLHAAHAYWDAARRKEQAKACGLHSERVFLLTGYIRERDLPRLEEYVRRELPWVSYTVSDPTPEDDVPVSITSPSFVRPLQLLVKMFGLPMYWSFDPTPFLMVNFLIFFGICFGDVGYGLMLTAFSGYVAHKSRRYEGLYNFARLFLYGGITTIFFGALTGSWFSDLPKYFGEGNPIQVLQQKMMVLDLLDKPVLGLLIALAIGVMNQFYGIALKAYGAILRKDYATAVFDALLWLLVLPGLLILISRMLTDISPALFSFGLFLFLAGALGLIFTQGRNEASLGGKLLTGIVSLYGILGSYGCTSFIGDMLSYCRLLALGLTTSIVAMSINLMAGMLQGIPYVGWILFLVVVTFGHVFNFLISVLGAFIHSARLVFVEFFGRFYEGGAQPFTPLGFNSAQYLLQRESSTQS